MSILEDRAFLRDLLEILALAAEFDGSRYVQGGGGICVFRQKLRYAESQLSGYQHAQRFGFSLFIHTTSRLLLMNIKAVIYII